MFHCANAGHLAAVRNPLVLRLLAASFEVALGCRGRSLAPPTLRLNRSHSAGDKKPNEGPSSSARNWSPKEETVQQLYTTTTWPQLGAVIHSFEENKRHTDCHGRNWAPPFIRWHGAADESAAANESPGEHAARPARHRVANAIAPSDDQGTLEGTLESRRRPHPPYYQNVSSDAKARAATRCPDRVAPR